jgi:hypothetical protein
VFFGLKRTATPSREIPEWEKIANDRRHRKFGVSKLYGEPTGLIDVEGGVAHRDRRIVAQHPPTRRMATVNGLDSVGLPILFDAEIEVQPNGDPGPFDEGPVCEKFGLNPLGTDFQKVVIRQRKQGSLTK